MTNLPPEAPPPATPTPSPSPAQPGSDANQLAMLAHLLGIFGFLPSLIIWLVKKEVPFVAQEAKEALNFQICVAIALIGCWILTMMFIFIAPPLCGLFSMLMWAVWIVNVIFSIIAGLKAKDGVAYRYFTPLRLIK